MSKEKDAVIFVQIKFFYHKLRISYQSTTYFSLVSVSKCSSWYKKKKMQTGMKLWNLFGAMYILPLNSMDSTVQKRPKNIEKNSNIQA